MLNETTDETLYIFILWVTYVINEIYRANNLTCKYTSMHDTNSFVNFFFRSHIYAKIQKPSCKIESFVRLPFQIFNFPFMKGMKSLLSDELRLPSSSLFIVTQMSSPAKLEMGQ